jgi:hypothetical protein
MSHWRPASTKQAFPELLGEGLSEKRRRLPVCKPNPVHPRGYRRAATDRPPSIWDRRCRRPLAAYPRRQAGYPVPTNRDWRCLALHPVRFTQPPPSRRRWWALTPPFHPSPDPRMNRGHRLVCSLLHLLCPTNRAPRGYRGTVPCGVRTFLPLPESGRGGDPTGRQRTIGTGALYCASELPDNATIVPAEVKKTFAGTGFI